MSEEQGGGGTRISLNYITYAARQSHMTRKSVNSVGRKPREEAADDDAPVYRQIPGSGGEPLGFVDSSGADLVGFGSTTDVSLCLITQHGLLTHKC